MVVEEKMIGYVFGGEDYLIETGEDGYAILNIERKPVYYVGCDSSNYPKSIAATGLNLEQLAEAMIYIVRHPTKPVPGMRKFTERPNFIVEEEISELVPLLKLYAELKKSCRESDELNEKIRNKNDLAQRIIDS